eukprot:7326094-Pyramimonas_sp.AAC.1
MHDFGFLGLFREASWGLFGPSWAVLEPSSGALEHSWARPCEYEVLCKGVYGFGDANIVYFTK